MIWQDMETAPKDGTPVLLRVPALGILPVVARWEGGDTEMGFAGWVDAHRGVMLVSVPDGWMAIPS